MVEQEVLVHGGGLEAQIGLAHEGERPTGAMEGEPFVGVNGSPHLGEPDCGIVRASEDGPEADPRPLPLTSAT